MTILCLSLALFSPAMLRCPCQEKEVDCLEKDLGIKDLKEQFVSLSSLVGQLRLNKAEIDHGNKSQVSALRLDVDQCFSIF